MAGIAPPPPLESSELHTFTNTYDKKLTVTMLLNAHTIRTISITSSVAIAIAIASMVVILYCSM